MTFEGQARGRLGHRFFHAKRVPLAKKIRLLGVRASGLIPVGEVDRDPAAAQAELPF